MSEYRKLVVVGDGACGKVLFLALPYDNRSPLFI
jgi:hypothetical protein